MLQAFKPYDVGDVTVWIDHAVGNKFDRFGEFLARALDTADQVRFA